MVDEAELMSLFKAVGSNMAGTALVVPLFNQASIRSQYTLHIWINKLPISFLYQLNLLNNCTMAGKCIKAKCIFITRPHIQ